MVEFLRKSKSLGEKFARVNNNNSNNFIETRLQGTIGKQ